MRLLKDYIFEQRDGVHVLLLHLAILLGLANDHSRSLRLEQHATGGDGACTTILNLVDANARKTYLEDADTIAKKCFMASPSSWSTALISLFFTLA